MLKDFENLLSKPCVVKKPGVDEYLCVIFSVSEVNSSYVSQEGQPAKETSYMANVLNVTMSLEEGCPFFEDHPLNDNSFREYQILDTEDVFPEFSHLAMILANEYVRISSALNGMTKCVSCVKSMMKTLMDGNHIIDLSVKNIFNNNIFNQDEVEKLAEPILELLLDNLALDVENKKDIEKLRKKIEMCVIKKLPSTFAVVDLDINMNEVINKLKELQQEEGNEL